MEPADNNYFKTIDSLRQEIEKENYELWAKNTRLKLNIADYIRKESFKIKFPVDDKGNRKSLFQPIEELNIDLNLFIKEEPVDKPKEDDNCSIQ